jgi:hypothetical protein
VSRSVEGNVDQLSARFAVLEAIRDHTESKGLYLCLGLRRGGPIRQDAWKFGNLGDPAAIVFALELDLKPQDTDLRSPSLPQAAPLPIISLPGEHRR